MNLFKFLVVTVLTILLSYCTPKYVVDTSFDEELLDTLTVTAQRVIDPAEEYRASFNKSVDITHTELDLSFDWEEESVIGTALLDITPVFYDVDHVQLDAVGFDIHAIEIDNQSVSDYTYDGLQITILLGKNLQQGQSSSLKIEYTAHPAASRNDNTAISSDQGLFFIDPRGQFENVPTQIWTQGETEYNSRWYPTIDKPNMRFSQKVSVTVPDSLKTLCNGKLIASNAIENNLRTDVWVQELPHAPYLTMLAVGDYAVVEEIHKDLLLQYYVYPEYEQDAQQIFNHTAEMIDFFSSRIGYPYPWDKYSQVIVDDFVSGAMENTGAVIFGDFVQHDSRMLVDFPNDDIVAHELFHHWFGNLVTCESWSNLTMNEGFANYSEYLWREYKYGRDHADAHRKNEIESYIATAASGNTHDLIHFSYEDKEDMFDVHSYNKGGLVLHMLRQKIGDEAFFAGLQHYLKSHAYTAVEAHDLRLAFEAITGMDLNPFFNQWYFDSGHPIINFDYQVQGDNVTLVTTQTQTKPNHREVFLLDARPIVYYTDGSKDTLDWYITKRKDSRTFPINGEIGTVVLDGPNDLLAEINQNRDEKEHQTLASYSEEYKDLIDVIDAKTVLTEVQFERLSQHPQENIRVKMLQKYAEQYQLSELMTILRVDPSGHVRQVAYSLLYSIGSPQEILDATSLALNDRSYLVESDALFVLSTLDEAAYTVKADSILQANPLPYLATLASVASEVLEADDFNFYRKHLADCVNNDIYFPVQDYVRLSGLSSLEEKIASHKHLKNLYNQSSAYYKQYLYKSSITKLEELIDAEIKNGLPEETDLSEYIKFIERP